MLNINFLRLAINHICQHRYVINLIADIPQKSKMNLLARTVLLIWNSYCKYKYYVD